jgi:fluoroquinolone transport system permease protein
VKPLLRTFRIFIRQITEDDMLWAVCLAPLLAGLVFKFGIPFAEKQLCGYFGLNAILTPYYLLFDLFLCLLTPYMFCYASSMVMLIEHDANLTGYMAVTPVGRTGYILSRLAIPAALSFAAAVIVMLFFSLTAWRLGLLLIISFLMCALSIAGSMIIFSFSRNKVEGMAIAKLSGLFMLGLPVPFFMTSSVQYLFSPLPTFWLAKLCLNRNPLFLLPALVTLLVWLWLLYRRFSLKLR